MLNKCAKYQGDGPMVQTSKTDHFFKLAPFWSPLTDLIDFGMAGKLLPSANRWCSPFVDSVSRIWIKPKKSLIGCWAPTATTYGQSAPSRVQLTAGRNGHNRHFERLSLVSSVCRSLCTGKIELYIFFFFFFLPVSVVSSRSLDEVMTENRGKGNSAKGKEEQKPVTTVALDRVCVRAWLRHVWRCKCACICQENVYVKEKMCMHTAVRRWQLSKKRLRLGWIEDLTVLP